MYCCNLAYKNHSRCQKNPRLLSGTLKVLLDSLSDSSGEPKRWMTSRTYRDLKIEIYSCNLAYGNHSRCQKDPRLLSGTLKVPLDSLSNSSGELKRWMTSRPYIDLHDSRMVRRS